MILNEVPMPELVAYTFDADGKMVPYVFRGTPREIPPDPVPPAVAIITPDANGNVQVPLAALTAMCRLMAHGIASLNHWSCDLMNVPWNEVADQYRALYSGGNGDHTIDDLEGALRIARRIGLPHPNPDGTAGAWPGGMGSRAGGL